jgi:hypothetical protein
VIDIDAVNMDDDEWTQDISVVAGLLKQWFRELPEPLLPPHQYHAFMEAARKPVILSWSRNLFGFSRERK